MFTYDLDDYLYNDDGDSIIRNGRTDLIYRKKVGSFIKDHYTLYKKYGFKIGVRKLN